MVARLGRDWELFYCQCDLLLSYFTVLVSNFVVEFGLETMRMRYAASCRVGIQGWLQRDVCSVAEIQGAADIIMLLLTHSPVTPNTFSSNHSANWISIVSRKKGDGERRSRTA